MDIRKIGGIALTIIAIGGTIATAVFAAKETPKAIEELEKAKQEKGEELTTFEKVKVVAPCYKVAIAIGAGTILTIGGIYILNEKRCASLSGAAAFINNSYVQYQEKVKELYGEEAHEKVQDAIAEDIHAVDMDITFTDSIGGLACDMANVVDEQEQVLFYDEWSKRFFYSTPLKVYAAIHHWNRNFVLGGRVEMNMFYDFLGLDPINGGDDMGYDVESGLVLIDFMFKKKFRSDGTKYYEIIHQWGPDVFDFNA